MDLELIRFYQRQRTSQTTKVIPKDFAVKTMLSRATGHQCQSVPTPQKHCWQAMFRMQYIAGTWYIEFRFGVPSPGFRSQGHRLQKGVSPISGRSPNQTNGVIAKGSATTTPPVSFFSAQSSGHFLMPSRAFARTACVWREWRSNTRLSSRRMELNSAAEQIRVLNRSRCKRLNHRKTSARQRKVCRHACRTVKTIE